MKTSYVLVDSDDKWIPSDLYPNGVIQFSNLNSAIIKLENLEADGLMDLSIMRIQEAKVKLVRRRY